MLSGSNGAHVSYRSHVPAVRRCPAINDTVNARLVSGAKPYTPNSVLEYECNVGYELTSGHLQRSCKLDGKWTGDSLQCTGDTVV